MFADKSMQGLTFLLSAFLCQVEKIERPCPALCLQMARPALLSDDARLQMGSLYRASCSSLDLCQAALMQKKAQESKSRLQPGAERSVYVQFHVPRLSCPHGPTPEGGHSFALGWFGDYRSELQSRLQTLLIAAWGSWSSRPSFLKWASQAAGP